MSDDKQGSSVSEGQASPPAGDRYDATNAVRLCVRCEDESGISAGADAGDRACAICGQHDAPHIYVALSHTGGSVGPEQADVAVLPEAITHICGDDCSRREDSSEAVSLSGLEQTVEAMIAAASKFYGARKRAEEGLAAALSTGQIVRASEFLGKNVEQWSEIVSQKSQSEDRLFLRAEKAEAEVERLRAMREITDETVRRACRAYLAERDVWPEESAMRAALRAALSEGERHG